DGTWGRSFASLLPCLSSVLRLPRGLTLTSLSLEDPVECIHYFALTVVTFDKGEPRPAQRFTLNLPFICLYTLRKSSKLASGRQRFTSIQQHQVSTATQTETSHTL
ncbi:unnamed protein product, partial [Scytosiphon promiscuus]